MVVGPYTEVGCLGPSPCARAAQGASVYAQLRGDCARAGCERSAVRARRTRGRAQRELVCVCVHMQAGWAGCVGSEVGGWGGGVGWVGCWLGVGGGGN